MDAADVGIIKLSLKHIADQQEKMLSLQREMNGKVNTNASEIALVCQRVDAHLAAGPTKACVILAGHLEDHDAPVKVVEDKLGEVKKRLERESRITTVIAAIPGLAVLADRVMGASVVRIIGEKIAALFVR